MHSIGAQKAKYKFPPRLIKRIQRGEITIPAGSNLGYGTILKVDVNNCLIFFNGMRSAETSLDSTQDIPRLTILTNTLAFASTNAVNATNTRVVAFTLIEFYNYPIKKIQQGTISISGANTSASASIAAVDLNNAFVIHHGQLHTANSADFNVNQGRVSFQSSTSILAEKDSGATPSLFVQYTAIEFHPGVIRSIQQIEVAIAALSTTGDQVINEVDDRSSVLFWGGWNPGTATVSDVRTLPYIQRTSTTNVRATRNSGLSNDVTVNCTVVEFEPWFIKTRQASVDQIASGQSALDEAINPINLERSIISWLGATPGAVSSGVEGAYGTVVFNSASELGFDRGSNPALTLDTSWEVVEFL